MQMLVTITPWSPSHHGHHHTMVTITPQARAAPRERCHDDRSVRSAVDREQLAAGVPEHGLWVRRPAPPGLRQAAQLLRAREPPTQPQRAPPPAAGVAQARCCEEARGAPPPPTTTVPRPIRSADALTLILGSSSSSSSSSSSARLISLRK
jgi:hypothetical protein